MVQDGYSKISSFIKQRFDIPDSVSRRELLLFLGFIIAIPLIAFGIDSVLELFNTGSQDVNLINRNIESPAKKIIKGYFGLFFKFDFFGQLAWLGIPCSIFLLVKFWNAPKTKFFAFSFTLAFILVALKGYFNSRYALTLFPLLYCIILIGIYELFKKQTYVFTLAFYFFAVIWLISIFFSPHKSTTKESNINIEKYYTNPFLIFDKVVASVKKKKFVKHKFIPEKTIAYINSMNLQEGESILCNNLPFVYYYTNKKFKYYWCGDDLYWDATGKHPFFGSKSPRDAKQFIEQELQCRYIFSYLPYNEYDPKFKQFLHTYCVVVKKEMDYILYKII